MNSDNFLRAESAIQQSVLSIRVHKSSYVEQPLDQFRDKCKLRKRAMQATCG